MLRIVQATRHICLRSEHTADVSITLRADAGAVFQTDWDGVEHVVMVQEITRPRNDFDAAEVTHRVRQRIAERHGIEVDEVVLVRAATLPKTTSGKIRRQACRAAYEAGQLVRWQPRS